MPHVEPDRPLERRAVRRCRTPGPPPPLERGEGPSRRRNRGFKRWVAAGALGLAALLGVIVYVTTDSGTIKITGIDPMMRVLIDGQEIRIENLGKPITIRCGPHQLLVTRDDMEAKADSFFIWRGVEKVLEVTYTPKAREVVRKDPEPPKPASRSDLNPSRWRPLTRGHR